MRAWAWLAGLWIGGVVACSSQQGSGTARVRLEPADGRTSYVLGEPITLDLVFTGPAPGATLNTTVYGDLSEDVTITPAEGWFRSSGRSGHDYGTAEALTEKPVRVPVLLNQGFVFEKPGHYTVTVTTNRLALKGEDFRSNARTTNAVTLDLVAPDEAAEAARVRLLDARIAAETECNKREEALTELAFLGGDAAIRAKVRWLRALEEDPMAGNLLQNLNAGLASSRNFPLQQQLLEAEWRDTTHAADFSVLGALLATRGYARRLTQPGWQMSMAVRNDAETQRAEAERAGYVHEAVVSLPARSGENRTDTAYWLMESGGLTGPDAATVRQVALQEFPHMSVMAQSMLIETRWKEMRDSSLVPMLAAMLDRTGKDAAGDESNHHDSLERLIELDPERARPYVVREVCDPRGSVALKQLGGLPDATLPAVDSCLAAQIRGWGSSGQDGRTGYLEDAKMQDAARYATAALLPVVTARYAAVKGKVAAQYEGAYLAYLLRWAPAQAVEEIRRTGLDNAGFELGNVFEQRHARFPAELDEWLDGQMTSGTAQQAGMAAYQLSRFGRAEDRPVLEARLRELRRQWAGHSDVEGAAYETEAGKAMMAEVNLVSALVGSESVWKLTATERAQWGQGCLSSRCRAYFATEKR